MVGGVLSNTVMVCAQVALFPQTSVAVYILVTVNRFAHVILEITSGATVTNMIPAQLSFTNTLLVLEAGISLAHWTVTFAGQTMVGGISSCTVIICAHVAELPQTSVAV